MTNDLVQAHFHRRGNGRGSSDTMNAGEVAAKLVKEKYHRTI